MPSQRPENRVDHAAEGVDDGAEGVNDENPPVDRDDNNEDPPVDEENVAEDVAEDEDGDGDDDGQAPVVPEEGYGGGPTDLSLLHEYHKHRAAQIWEATSSEAPILKKVMRSVANGKKAYMAKSCKKLGKRVGLMAGYMSLLQGWVISHMPRMSVWKLFL
ncbi:hypothetical protein P8452_16375 [Trifolium repens]|nr:hypothetical protein P8452_16375 [Trifolium repens]